MPQPAGQPATRTNELHGKDAWGSPDRGELGPPSPHCTDPLLGPTPTTPLPLYFGLAHGGLGLGSWQVAGGREEGVRAQLSLSSGNRGLSQGLAVGRARGRLRLGGAPGSAGTGPSRTGTAPAAGCSWRIRTGSGAGRWLRPGQRLGPPWSLWESDKRQQVPRGAGSQAGAEIRPREGGPSSVHSIQAGLQRGALFAPRVV